MECRLCLGFFPPESSVPIYDKQILLNNNIWSLRQPQVRKHETVPDTICSSCDSNLKSLADFKKMCIQNNNKARLELGNCSNIAQEEVKLDDLVWENESNETSLPSDNDDNVMLSSGVEDLKPIGNLHEFTTQYRSESDEDENIETRRQKKRLASQNWLKFMEFETAESATNHVKNLKTWENVTTYNGTDGRQVFYRCAAGKYGYKECPAAIYLLFHSESSIVSLYVTQNEHNNHRKEIGGLSTTEREIVHQLFDDGIRKPQAIVAAFQTRGLQRPEKIKLQGFLARLRRENIKPSIISMRDVYNWCKIRTNVPAGEDNPFVLGFNAKFDNKNERNLTIVISTKRLLQLAYKSEGVQTDATHKLIWHGNSVLIVGTSDMNQMFHPFAIAVCKNETESDLTFIFNCIKDSCYKICHTEWNPKILLADASSGITDGFKTVFGISFRRLTCYFQVVKNINGKLRGITDKDEIKSDIECLHLCPDDNTFNVVSELFIKKWKEINDVEIALFIDYFESAWIHINRYWYVGASNYFPTTNYGLEATVIPIKREHTFYERLPVDRFLEVISNGILKKWSNERNPENPNYKPFATRPERSAKIWADAYLWVKLNAKVYTEINGNVSVIYILPSHIKRDINADMVRSFEDMYLKWDTFDGYKSEYSNCMWKVTITSNNDNLVSTCSCPVYAKQYICEHSLGVLILIGKEKGPNEVFAL